ncbi:MAG TPA: PAS domain S-box protein [Alphaproteobacteria bacterium]|nr:PAS domain S-box protein [Alphaproteobacteria bacterium]
MTENPGPNAWTEEHRESGGPSALPGGSLGHDDGIYRVLIDRLQDGVFLVADERFCFVNEAFARAVGYRREEMIGLPFLEVTAPEERDQVLRRYRARISGEVPSETYELRLLHRNGIDRIDAVMNVSAVLLPDGRTGTTGSIRDVSEQIRALRSLRQSEAELREIIAKMADMFYRTDAEGRVLMVSPSVERQLGYRAEEIIGTSLADFYMQPEQRAEVLAAIVAGGGEPVQVRSPLRHKDGHVVEVDTIAYLRLDENGDPLGVEGIARDVTEQRQAESELRESEARYRLLVELSPDAIVVHDYERVLYANASAARIFADGNAERLIGRRLIDHVHPDNRAFAIERVRRFREGAATQPFVEELLVDEAGEPVYCEVAGARVSWRGQDAVQLVIRDISERKRVEQVLTAARSAAEQANRAKSDFLAMVSHELRTPLNAILGFSEIIATEAFGPAGDVRYRGYAEDIHNSGRHLLELITDILDLSRIESDNLQLDEEDVEVGLLAADCARLLQERARRAGLHLRQVVEAGLPVLQADRLRLKQVLINLLTNAVKFTPAGGTVTLGAGRLGDGRLRLWVEDTGIGIPAEDLPRVINPFVQAGGSYVRKNEGIGLGLALCKRLVEMHDGELEIVSEPESGTCVSVLLPLDRLIRDDDGPV